MASITVRARYPQSPSTVWDELRHIDRHVHWMMDAVSISFTDERREGVGTSFRCVTKLGPFRVDDLMTVTAWEDGRVMGVAHHGLVIGEGTFTLRGDDEGTLMIWRERLSMPWRLLGPLGAAVASPFLRLVWRRNLANLGRRLEEVAPTWRRY